MFIIVIEAHLSETVLQRLSLGALLLYAGDLVISSDDLNDL